MNYRAILLAVCFPLLASADPAALSEKNPPPPATLRWSNGETLTGEFLAGSEKELSWKNSSFEEPLRLRWGALNRIEQPLAAQDSGEPFGIALKDGSFIYGNIVGLTDQSILIRSARHGDSELKRTEVVSISRRTGKNLIYSGPEGGVAWDADPIKPPKEKKDAPKPNAKQNPAKAQNPPKAVPKPPAEKPVKLGLFVPAPGGGMTMPFWNRKAFRDVRFPEMVELEFSLHGTKRPEFALTLLPSGKPKLRIETWDDELVFFVGDEFKRILQLSDDQKELSLRVYWNRKSKEVSAYTVEGELLAQWQVPESSNAESIGIAVENKGRDLTLDTLKVREWNGAMPAKIDPKKTRLQLADGSMIEGDIPGFADGAVRVTVADGSEKTIPLDEIDGIRFASKPFEPNDEETKLTFADGTTLTGRILSINDGQAALAVNFANKPFSTNLNGLRQWLVRSHEYGPEFPLDFLDQITLQQVVLHGKWVNAGEASPRWLPVGGLQAVLPVSGMLTEMTRTLGPDAPMPPATSLVYTMSGDILPASLRNIDRKEVEFDSNELGVQTLPVETVAAIQFQSPPNAKVTGFDDPAWQIVKGTDKTVVRADGKVSMEPETSLFHPTAMQGTEINFRLEPMSDMTAVRVRMFCGEGGEKKGAALLIGGWGTRMISGMESGEGQFRTQSQTTMDRSQGVDVRITVFPRQIELAFNGSPVNRYSVAPADRTGVGLTLEATSMWGNRANALKLSKFSAPSKPGRTTLPVVNAEAKMQAITVPRFRKEDPPRHVLLASNGDLLRGEIEAMTQSHFGFRSGLENLKVPRDRVKALIWLQKPRDTGEAAPVVSAIEKILNQKIQDPTTYGGAALSSLTGYLQHEAPGLTIKLPEKKDNRRNVTFEFAEGSTVGDSLEQICSLFNLRYRVEGENTIVLETSAAKTKEVQQKLYWLKTDPFGTSSAKDVLTSKGLTFPPGTSVSWEKTSKQLLMTNSPECHEQLVALIDSDLGGSNGSPTYWLMLTSGGRFPMMIDRFDSDTIYGRHPIYGECKIPTADVYSITTNPPEVTPTMKLIDDWHLVYAPEPVIPESGGESSPLIGKPAEVFKLPLLGGGDFDLAKEKGKVIVLDFWATWCGPCVKSLPGLIDAMAAFPPDKVRLIGVNQSEPADQVKRFIETRKWNLTVALDASQKVAHQYGVEGIPHTVIIGPDGKIAWTKTGYSPDGDAEAAKAVTELLGKISNASNNESQPGAGQTN